MLNFRIPRRSFTFTFQLKRTFAARIASGPTNKARTSYLQGDDPQAIHAMLRFFYGKEYDDRHKDKQAVPFNAIMYVIAAKYDISLLKDLAELKFSAALKDKSFDPSAIPALMEATQVIYTKIPGVDRTLRDILAMEFKAHKNMLRKDDGFMKLVKSGLADGEFAVDVMDEWADFREIARSIAPTCAWTCRYCFSLNSRYEAGCRDCYRTRAGCEVQRAM